MDQNTKEIYLRKFLPITLEYLMNKVDLQEEQVEQDNAIRSKQEFKVI